MKTIFIQRHHAFYLIGPLGVAANVVYAGLRAQNKDDTHFIRKVAFVLGFPASLITFLAVDEGSCIAFGIDLPKKLKTTQWTEIGSITGRSSRSVPGIERRNITVIQDE